MSHSWWNPYSLICLILWLIQHCTAFELCGIHLAVVSHIFQLCCEIWSSVDPEILVCLANLSQSSIFVHSCTVQLWPQNVCVNGHCSVNPSSFECVYSAFNLFVIVRCNHPVLRSYLHGTLCWISIVHKFTYESRWSLQTSICKWDHQCGDMGTESGCAAL